MRPVCVVGRQAVCRSQAGALRARGDEKNQNPSSFRGPGRQCLWTRERGLAGGVSVGLKEKDPGFSLEQVTGSGVPHDTEGTEHGSVEARGSKVVFQACLKCLLDLLVEMVNTWACCLENPSEPQWS